MKVNSKMATEVENTQEYAPIKIGKKKGAKKILLFEIEKEDGSTDQFFILDKQRPQLLLSTAKVIRDKGQGAGELHLLEQVLGEEAFDRLMANEDLEDYELEAIINQAVKISIGDLENLPKDHQEAS